MPRPKKKDPQDWTTEEALDRLFPKKVRDRARSEVEASKEPQVSPSEKSIKEEDS
jgi:hypothetical protein